MTKLLRNLRIAAQLLDVGLTHFLKLIRELPVLHGEDLPVLDDGAALLAHPVRLGLVLALELNQAVHHATLVFLLNLVVATKNQKVSDYLFKSRLCLHGGTLKKQESIGFRKKCSKYSSKNKIYCRHIWSKLVSLR